MVFARVVALFGEGGDELHAGDLIQLGWALDEGLTRGVRLDLALAAESL
jgi:hypothetical protein